MAQRTALVTGAARGIGAAIAHCLREQDVHVLDAGRADLDLSDVASISAWLSRHGSDVDILVNNAGVNVLNDLEAITPKDWQAMVQVDLTAPLMLLQGVAPGMKARGWGRVVNISSIFGVVTKERRGAYSAVKAGLNGLTLDGSSGTSPFRRSRQFRLPRLCGDRPDAAKQFARRPRKDRRLHSRRTAGQAGGDRPLSGLAVRRIEHLSNRADDSG